MLLKSILQVWIRHYRYLYFFSNDYYFRAALTNLMFFCSFLIIHPPDHRLNLPGSNVKPGHLVTHNKRHFRKVLVQSLTRLRFEQNPSSWKEGIKDENDDKLNFTTLSILPLNQKCFKFFTKFKNIAYALNVVRVTPCSTGHRTRWHRRTSRKSLTDFKGTTAHNATFICFSYLVF